MKTAVILMIDPYPFSYSDSGKILDSISDTGMQYAESRDKSKIGIGVGINRHKNITLYTFVKGNRHALIDVLNIIWRGNDRTGSDFLGYILLANAELISYREAHANLWFMFYGLSKEDDMLPDAQHFHIRKLKSELDALREYDPDGRFIVASFDHDLEDAMSVHDIREELDLNEDDKIVPFDLNDRDSVINVFLELVDILDVSPVVVDVRQLLESL